MSKLVIQIPCFNEETTIAEAIKELPKQIEGIDQILILVIDDGSHDNTAEIALKNGADIVIQHPTNRGLARTFMTGIEASLALGADIIVNTDADNQYPGHYITQLVKPILDKQANLVIGNRQVENNIHFSPIKRALESFGSWIMRIISNTDVPDAPSGFRAYSRFTALRLQVYNQFSYTLETLIQAGRTRTNIVHVPIHTNPATRPSRLHKGIFHFIWNQGGTILRSYVLYQPLKTFLQVSFPFFLLSIILIGRFLFFYLTDQTGVGRYAQSVSIGGTLGVFGLLLVMIGLLADANSTNRQLLESILVAQRDNIKITPDNSSFYGFSLLRKNDKIITRSQSDINS